MSKSPFSILNASNQVDRRIWSKAWHTWPEREVHAHPGYVQLYTEGEKYRALCALWNSPEGTVLYPFLLRDISYELYWNADIGPVADIITPYGYGGPYVYGNSTAWKVTEDFWSEFGAWIERERIVSEFVRLSLFEDTLLPYPGEKKEKLQNVVLDLNQEHDILWQTFKHKVRKNVNRALSSGVTVEIDPIGERLDDFLRIYQHTMSRRCADGGYYFPRSYFERLHSCLQGQFMYFHAFHGDRIISTELVLLSETNVYSFLGGTDSESFDLRPNDLLKYRIIIWARQCGKHRFIIGGGYRDGDGIYQYKLAFSPNGSVPFFTGHRIFRRDLYEALVQERSTLAHKNELVWRPNSDYFPLYRS